MPLPLQIQIAGPSASGKSTLARLAAEHLGLPVFCLDEFFIPRPARYVSTPDGPVRNYEDPRSYDGARMARRIEESGGPAVAEGFCLFAYPEVMAAPAVRFYLDVPFPVCARRRSARSPARPSDRSFALIGKDESARHVEPQKHLPGVTVLNGMGLLGDNLEMVLAAYRQRVNTCTAHS